MPLPLVAAAAALSGGAASFWKFIGGGGGGGANEGEDEVRTRHGGVRSASDADGLDRSPRRGRARDDEEEALDAEDAASAALADGTPLGLGDRYGGGGAGVDDADVNQAPLWDAEQPFDDDEDDEGDEGDEWVPRGERGEAAGATAPPRALGGDDGRDEVALAVLEGEDTLEVAATAAELGEACTAMEAHSDAEPLLRKAYEVRLSLLGAEERLTLESLYALAVNLRELRRYAESVPLLTDMVNVLEHTHGSEHLSVGNALVCLGDVQVAWGKMSLAERSWSAGLRIQQEALGHEHATCQQTAEMLEVLKGRMRKDSLRTSLLRNKLLHMAAARGSEGAVLMDV